MVHVHTRCFRRRLFGRVRSLLLREVLVHEDRGRTAVLDRADEPNWRLQELHHTRGLLRRLRVLKLRECRSTSETGGLGGPA